jgi:hypothetical protein
MIKFASMYAHNDTPTGVSMLKRPLGRCRTHTERMRQVLKLVSKSVILFSSSETAVDPFYGATLRDFVNP